MGHNLPSCKVILASVSAGCAHGLVQPCPCHLSCVMLSMEDTAVITQGTRASASLNSCRWVCANRTFCVTRFSVQTSAVCYSVAAPP